MTSLELAGRLRQLSREALVLRDGLRRLQDSEVLKKEPDLPLRDYALRELERAAIMCEALAILVESP